MKTKIITGIVLALFLVTMLSTPAMANLNGPAAFFAGEVTACPYVEDEAWGKVYARVYGDKITAFAWFYVPKIRVSVVMKLVEVEEVEIAEDKMIIKGLWTYSENNKPYDDIPFSLEVDAEEFMIRYLYEEPFVIGKTMRYKAWGLPTGPIIV